MPFLPIKMRKNQGKTSKFLRKNRVALRITKKQWGSATSGQQGQGIRFRHEEEFEVYFISHMEKGYDLSRST